ncbi:hypothetical protein GCM10009623_04580 [Nocardioides aestuarii]|uniref:SHOCT domain-containing protein n=1 Tax=Nocardioides aestuarii TaxID=252231 RepID=A0ABW4TG54_9ACTN
MPTWFAVGVTLMLVVAVASAVWRASTARRMARDAGMSEGDATAMALLTDDGLAATYTASSIRAGDDAPTAAPASAEARLSELRGLLDQGLVTQEEYDAARRRIIDGL